jgi:sulfite exporter TauE/SafE
MTDANAPPEPGEDAPKSSRPVGIKVLVAVNALAALTLLIMFPQYTGGRALLYLCVGILHGVLGIGLFLQANWARVLMIVYALFQVAGMSLWALIGLMTLVAQPLSAEKAQFLVLAAVAIPFLSWSVFYLLGQLRRAADPPPG